MMSALAMNVTLREFVLEFAKFASRKEFDTVRSCPLKKFDDEAERRSSQNEKEERDAASVVEVALITNLSYPVVEPPATNEK